MRPRVLRLLLLFVSVSVITRWLSFVIDVIDLDETCHFIGAQVLSAGGLLYTDFVDNKPPLLYVYYALAQLAPGRGLLSVHLVTALIVVPLTALALSAFYDHARAGVSAALAFLVFSAAFIGHDMLSTNAEIVMILPASWALVLLRHGPGSGRTRRLFLAGVLFGAGVLVKPQVGTWAAAAAGVILYLRGGVRQRWRGLGEVAALAAGGAVPLVAAYAWFAAHHGADALLYWVVRNSVWYVENPILAREAARRFAAYFVPFVAVTAPLWWATVRASSVVQPPGRRLLVMSLVAASLPPAFLGFRFFPHYFIQLYVPLALAAGPALGSVLGQRPLSVAGRVVAGWSMVMLLGFTIANAALYFGHIRSYRERDPVFQAVADRLRGDPCAPGSLFVWGWAPIIYYLADLPPASRFVVLPQSRLTGYQFGNTESERGNAEEGATVPEHWRWLLDDLDRNKATFIVDTAPANLYRWGRYPISRYPVLQQYLDLDFERAADVRGVVIYRRRGCQADPRQVGGE